MTNTPDRPASEEERLAREKADRALRHFSEEIAAMFTTSGLAREQATDRIHTAMRAAVANDRQHFGTRYALSQVREGLEGLARKLCKWCAKEDKPVMGVAPPSATPLFWVHGLGFYCDANPVHYRLRVLLGAQKEP